jgi:hypothetical protein
MNINIDYSSYRFKDPYYYQRNFSNDALTFQEDGYAQLINRISIASLPFLSAIKGFDKPINFAANGMRLFKDCTEIIKSFKEGLSLQNVKCFIDLATTISCIAAATLNFTLGLVLVAVTDLITHISDFIKCIKNNKYTESCEAFLQIINSCMYITTLLSTTLETAFFSLIAQSVLSFYQAYQELKDDKLIEGSLKFFLGVFRLYQARELSFTLMKKYELDKEFLEFNKCLKNVWQVNHLLNTSIDINDEGQVIVYDADNNPINFGKTLHGFGSSLVKGDNITLKSKRIGNKDVIEVSFKLNHAFRDDLESHITSLKHSLGDDLNSYLKLNSLSIDSIDIKTVPFSINDSNSIGSAHEITFGNQGRVVVGASKHLPTLYGKVKVYIDKGKSLYDMHEMLSVLNLDKSLAKSTSEDIERLKIGQLFRTIYPKEAFGFERSKDFYTLSVKSLKEKIIYMQPKMKQIFAKFLDHMKPVEILPGKMRYAVKGLAQVAKKLGARALTASLTASYCDKDIAKSIANILKSGMLSSETRFESGINKQGLSSYQDFNTGGADSVFTQLISEKDIKDGNSFDQFYYHGKARLIFSLDLLESGTYQYHEDSFGTRVGNTYKNRSGILDFVYDENHNYKYTPGNEVMIKERIDPNYIQCIVVQNENTKTSLIDNLRSYNVISKDNTILGRPLNDFIKVAHRISEVVSL